MSLNAKFANWEELIEHLQKSDPPQCFTVNYLLDEDVYEMWIGNQPYYTYEQLIELEQQEKRELRLRNRHYKGTLKQIEKHYWTKVIK